LNKRCTVAYATASEQHLWEVELPADADIAAALAAARRCAPPELAAGIAWDCLAVGIYGAVRGRHESCRDGDRIELYRPLRADPRERRRARVQRQRDLRQR
jgi:putative ubiquitin-RnfH superfamily antitoxin RatB of RatAB toxin-antitoxin module